MSIVDAAVWLQLINAAAFWPIFWLMGKRGPGWKAKSLTVAGFLAISILTFLMGYFSPSEPEFFLAGSPDGQSRALATFTRPNDQQVQIELQAWRLGSEDRKMSQRTEVADPQIINHCNLIWDTDSQMVRLVDRYLVLDLNRSSSVLELEVPK